MDLRKIKKLIDLLEESNLAELEIKEGEEVVRLSRVPKGGVAVAAPAPVATVAAPVPAPAASAPAEAPTARALPAGHASILLYPMLPLPGCGRTRAALRAFRQGGSQPPGSSGSAIAAQKSVSIQSIIERSSLPSRSSGWSAASLRMRRKFSWPARFSAIHSRANSPDWISPRMSFIAWRVSAPITRVPRE